MEAGSLLDAIASAAESWRDPDFERRAAAVEKTLIAKNAFTEEAVAFAVNQQMALLTADGLREWIAGRYTNTPLAIGVLNAGNVPLVGLQDFLAVVLTGHSYLASVSSKSPALLPSFCDDVRRRSPYLQAEFMDAESIFSRADAVIATGRDDTAAWVREQCRMDGIPADRQIVRGHRFSVAVFDGRETEDDFDRFAEDALLHEGFGCRNVAIVWAPAGLSPDPFLDALARFRGVFPAHADTPGRLRIQRAFLEAVEAPHAYGEGLEFLLSKGDPEEQPPGHVRWAEYRDMAAVDGWLIENAERVQLVVAGDSAAQRLQTSLPLVPPGDAQRPGLAWSPDGIDIVDAVVQLR